MCLNWVEISAISTFILAVTAVLAAFKDELLWHWKKPVLKVSVSPKPPDCHKIDLNQFGLGGNIILSAPCYYFRLRVENEGETVAESVEVFADKLEKLGANQRYEAVESFLPLNLVWAHIGGMYFPSITPDIYKHCDLGHIIEPRLRGRFGPYENNTWENVDNENSTILSLDTYVKPNTLSHLLPPGKYRLTVVVAANNVKPKKITLQINMTGNWFDDERRMLTEGIGVEILEN
jgi:hypothetical protein